MAKQGHSPAVSADRTKGPWWRLPEPGSCYCHSSLGMLGSSWFRPGSAMQGTLCCPQARDGVWVWLTGSADAVVKVKGLRLPGAAPSPWVSGPCVHACACAAEPAEASLVTGGLGGGVCSSCVKRKLTGWSLLPPAGLTGTWEHEPKQSGI